MSKIARKRRRILQLCKNKKYRFERTLSTVDKKEISDWCDENLSGGYFWFEIKSDYWKSTMEIGFHDKIDLVAFIWRWT